MTAPIQISQAEIIHQLKLTYQVPAIVESIALRKIILSEAAELGLQASPAELQQAADSVRLLNRLKRADETWKWLQTHYLSLDDFEDIVRTNVLSSKLAQHLFAERVEPFFVEHQLDYIGAVLYEVVLDDPDLAMELFYSLQEEEISFAEMARQYIQDPEQRRMGGYRGICKRSELKPEISAAVFAARPPQLLKPILAAKGAHLIWVEELIQPELTETLRYQILSDLFADWLKQQLAQVEIMTNLNEAPLAPSWWPTSTAIG